MQDQVEKLRPGFPTFIPSSIKWEQSATFCSIAGGTKQVCRCLAQKRGERESPLSPKLRTVTPRTMRDVGGDGEGRREAAQPCPGDPTMQPGLGCHSRQRIAGPVLASRVLWYRNDGFTCLPSLAHQALKGSRLGMSTPVPQHPGAGHQPTYFKAELGDQTDSMFGG